MSAMLSDEDISKAFKQALQIGAESVVSQLGAVDGFNADPQVHIPLPSQLQSVKTLLGKAGLAGPVDDLELALNRAAEKATPQARSLFLDAVNEMTFTDVQQIYQGQQDAATRYFQQRMTPDLKKAMQPVVEESLGQVGALRLFDQVMSQYQSLPFVPNVTADLTNHVLDRGMEGIFHYLAQQEAEIRKNPLKQSTELLKKVFAQ
ncbi:MAG TPA: DUF4197 domain-containing protein [Gammaproteobacteria bacterium]|nr:DUF4197 domain-containing protein [Gammaproteobacteria bacterium]